MAPLENLHYAIGQLAYAIANVDGKVQKEERNKFHSIVEAELRCKDYAFDISGIIFQILDQDRQDTETAYNGAFEQIKLNSHYLSPQLKATFIKVMEKVARAYTPVTNNERNLIERFRYDISGIYGDPIYYEKAL